ncbi:MAG: LysR substrate-binding domain-containing protein [Phenylobacterium sp.]|uniref:LysR substrate-binding domain-containing protein n=1 Tax=Phenylobacterium sp. TaxID=1871053 RepID=UPI00391DA1FD
MRDLPPLSTLKAFDAVARLGSVTRAADELGRTHGAVSKQLRALQDHLGAPLFDRAGTGLELNARGRALAAAVAEALDGLARGYGAILAETRAPAVHVACSATFAMRWLAPRLPAFARAHPEVRVRLSMTSARDMRGEDADVLIAWDLTTYPAADRARAVRLADVSFGPVAAPGCRLERDGAVVRADCRIVHDFTSTAWDDWQARTGLTVVAGEERSFPHTHLCLEVALAGLGVALVERRMAAQELADGRLQAPFGFVPFEGGLMAVPAARGLSRGAQAFVDWLGGELSASV